MVFQNMQKSTGLNEIAATERKEAVFLTGCLLCFQLTCQCSHSQKGAISGFSSVMNESGPSPIEESVHPTSVQSPSMWGVSILRIKITERLVVYEHNKSLPHFGFICWRDRCQKVHLKPLKQISYAELHLLTFPRHELSALSSLRVLFDFK